MASPLLMSILIGSSSTISLGMIHKTMAPRNYNTSTDNYLVRSIYFMCFVVEQIAYRAMIAAAGFILFSLTLIGYTLMLTSSMIGYALMLATSMIGFAYAGVVIGLSLIGSALGTIAVLTFNAFKTLINALTKIFLIPSFLMTRNFYDSLDSYVATAASPSNNPNHVIIRSSFFTNTSLYRDYVEPTSQILSQLVLCTLPLSLGKFISYVTVSIVKPYYLSNIWPMISNNIFLTGATLFLSFYLPYLILVYIVSGLISSRQRQSDNLIVNLCRLITYPLALMMRAIDNYFGISFFKNAVSFGRSRTGTNISISINPTRRATTTQRPVHPNRVTNDSDPTLLQHSTTQLLQQITDQRASIKRRVSKKMGSKSIFSFFLSKSEHLIDVKATELASEFDSKIEEAGLCMISNELLEFPVLLDDGSPAGTYYDYANINRWVSQHHTSPWNRESVNTSSIIHDSGAYKAKIQSKYQEACDELEQSINHLSNKSPVANAPAP